MTSTTKGLDYKALGDAIYVTNAVLLLIVQFCNVAFTDRFMDPVYKQDQAFCGDSMESFNTDIGSVFLVSGTVLVGLAMDRMFLLQQGHSRDESMRSLNHFLDWGTIGYITHAVAHLGVYIDSGMGERPGPLDPEVVAANRFNAAFVASKIIPFGFMFLFPSLRHVSPPCISWKLQAIICVVASYVGLFFCPGHFAGFIVFGIWGLGATISNVWLDNANDKSKHNSTYPLLALYTSIYPFYFAMESWYCSKIWPIGASVFSDSLLCVAFLAIRFHRIQLAGLARKTKST